MDNTTLWVTLVLGLVGSGGVGVIISALVASRSNRATSENEARAQTTAEFNAFVVAYKVRMGELTAEIAEMKEDMNRLRKEHKDAETYIDTLILGISNKTIPPIPKRY